jgi:predicted nucleotide-binding protein
MQTDPKKPASIRTKARRTSLFPASSFEEALELANAIQVRSAGPRVRRLTLFDQIRRSPESGPSLQLITNSNRYGLTKGSHTGEYLELTPDGDLATGVDISPREKLKARFRLAIENFPPFKALYNIAKDNRLPKSSALEEVAREHGVPEADLKACVETFVANAKFLDLCKPFAGAAERIISVDAALERLPGAVAETVPNSDDSSSLRRGVFVVHGHDEAAKEAAARFVEKLGLHAIILHEQTNEGRTVIEKFERHADVRFAVVLLTPDDVGTSACGRDNGRPRARQNVLFELGYFVGRLGRQKVCMLVKGDIEIPSDYGGVLYVRMDKEGMWRVLLAREIKGAGLDIDLNQAI